MTSSGFKARIQCKYCQKVGHYESECYSKERDERKKKQLEKKEKATQQEVQQNQKDDDGNKKRKFEQLTFMERPTTSWVVDAFVNEVKVQAIIDTCATCSAVAKSCVLDKNIKRNDVVPVRVGNGETIFSMGSTDLIMKMGTKEIVRKALVLETSAFQAVLGMDFMDDPRVNGILKNPPRILIDNMEFPIQEIKNGEQTSHRIYRLFGTESYKWKT